MATDKSQRPDDLHSRVLKEMAMEIVDVLVTIFQNSTDSRKVLADWRAANVNPPFKKGRESKKGNDRSVSITYVRLTSNDPLTSYLEILMVQHLAQQLLTNMLPSQLAGPCFPHSFPTHWGPGFWFTAYTPGLWFLYSPLSRATVQILHFYFINAQIIHCLPTQQIPIPFPFI